MLTDAFLSRLDALVLAMRGKAQGGAVGYDQGIAGEDICAFRGRQGVFGRAFNGVFSRVFGREEVEA